MGPKGSEVIPFSGIETPKKTLSLPIPKSIDRDGGAFEIDLGMYSQTIQRGYMVNRTF